MASVWLDCRNIEGGDDRKAEINGGLLNAQVVVALLPPHSVDLNRRWIRYEHFEANRRLHAAIQIMETNRLTQAFGG